jgi:hypothetical protein
VALHRVCRYRASTGSSSSRQPAARHSAPNHQTG